MSFEYLSIKPEMTAWGYLRQINQAMPSYFPSSEKRGTFATNSELKRWLQKGVLHINGETVAWDERIDDFPIFSMVLFPNNDKLRNTMI